MKQVPPFPALGGLLLSTAVLVLASTAARAQDNDSLLNYTFANGATLTSYGQINEAWLNFDDGQEQRDFAPVANANSSNRLGMLIENEINDASSVNFRAELQYMPRPSNQVNFSDPYVDDYALEKTDIRHLEVWYENESFGNFWGGQGKMASDDISEIDLSGTHVVARSAIPDTAGAFYFRETDGTLSGIQIKKAYSNLDGSRRMRVRYDTPTFGGFTFSAAYGQDVLVEDDDNDYYDAALRYDFTNDSIKLQSGVGYNWVEAPDGGNSTAFFSGSASALHVPTGLNATIAGGTRVDQDGDFWYGKLGVIRDFLSIGSTAISVDYGYGNQFAGNDGQFDSWSIEAVQRWKRTSMEFYAMYRLHEFGDDNADYDDGAAWFAGARWKF